MIIRIHSLIFHQNRQYLLRTVQVRRSSPMQKIFFLFSLPLTTRPRISHGTLMRSSTFRARSLTDQWRSKTQRHFIYYSRLDNTRLDFFDEILYTFSLFPVFSLYFTANWLTDWLLSWSNWLYDQRDDIMVPYFETTFFSISRGEWLAAWLASHFSFSSETRLFLFSFLNFIQVKRG